MAAEKIDALQLDITSSATTENVDKLIEALGRLGTALDKLKSKSISVSIDKTGDASARAAGSVNKLSNSFLQQAVRITAVIALFRKLGKVISDGVSNAMNYQKSLNMFTISMGEYADSASQYGETVRDALGIDIAGWQKTQGIFQTLITGFGVTGDKAAYMSQNITQLSYDIASFYGITNEEAANKLKSALSGRLEPIRKLGYDLSQSKLVDIAKNPANYGKQTFKINEQTGAIEANTTATDENTRHKIVNFNQLTQQEKVQLRYIALMTEVTQVQGNYARALNDPANQMNVFKEQLNMTSRALGNVFIPVLNKVLPYLSAFAQLAQQAFQSLANLMGFELPDMKDRTDISKNMKPYNDVVKATGKAAKNAKKMKDYMLGIDELNVFNPNTGAGAGSGKGNGENSNLKNLKLPGYDFLSKAVENSIKNAKEKLEKFFGAIKKNPYEIFTVIHLGAGELGSKIWELILGKTPEELYAEARAHGKTVNQEFFDQFVGKVGETGSDLWSLLLGKTPAELAQEANDNGRTEGEQFILGFLEKIAAERTWLVGTIFDSKHISERAKEAGRTYGEEFGIELTRAYLKAQKGNPLFEATTRLITGKSVDELLAGLEKKIPKKVEKKKTARDNNPYGYVSADNAKKYNEIHTARQKQELETKYNLKLNLLGNTSADEAKKAGEKYVKNFASGVTSGKSTVKSATEEGLYKPAYEGAKGGTNGELKYKYVSAEMAKQFASGFTTKTAKASAYNATAGLALQGVKGAKSQNGTTGGFNKAGNQAGAGFVLGIEAPKNVEKYKKAGGIIGLNALNELRKKLGINSPAKETIKDGGYTGEGFAIGLERSTKLVTTASKSLASSALTPLANASDLSNKVILNGTLANTMPSMTANVPSVSNSNYGVGVANQGAMASLASSVYQAVVSGIASANISNNDKDIKVVIDGKEVFKAVQTEQRKRGAVISNGAFSR